MSKPIYNFAAADRRVVTEAAQKFTDYGAAALKDVLEALNSAAKQGRISPDAAKIAIDDATAVAVASALVADRLREIAAGMPTGENDAARSETAAAEMGRAA